MATTQKNASKHRSQQRKKKVVCHFTCSSTSRQVKVSAPCACSDANPSPVQKKESWLWNRFSSPGCPSTPHLIAKTRDERWFNLKSIPEDFIGNHHLKCYSLISQIIVTEARDVINDSHKPPPTVVLLPLSSPLSLRMLVCVCVCVCVCVYICMCASIAFCILAFCYWQVSHSE